MRILSGSFKGRNLLSPPGQAMTRPMTGRVKKSLFDVLCARLDGARVMDLYCGTGTMGLEAISRGAARCWFAERDRQVVDRLRRNIADLGVEDRCTIWRGSVPSRLACWLDALDAPVDLAFVDPPFGQVRRWSWEQSDREIFTPLAARLARDGLAVLRVPGKVEAPDRLTALRRSDLRDYGGMSVALYAPSEGEE